MRIEKEIPLALSASGATFKEVGEKCIKIAEQHAIDFAEWLIDNYYTNPRFEYKTIKELLELYKKEKL